MEVVVSRRCDTDPGGLLRRASETFTLIIEVTFSAEELWAIRSRNLYHHEILDRTPPWYFTALREAQRAKERAEANGEHFEWPWFLPPSVPPEWKLTVADLLDNPVYAVSFDSAYELTQFEPRLRAACVQLKDFLMGYAARSETERWRL